MAVGRRRRRTHTGVQPPALGSHSGFSVRWHCAVASAVRVSASRSRAGGGAPSSAAHWRAGESREEMIGIGVDRESLPATAVRIGSGVECETHDRYAGSAGPSHRWRRHGTRRSGMWTSVFRCRPTPTQ
jgi:hypothetical protein